MRRLQTIHLLGGNPAGLRGEAHLLLEQPGHHDGELVEQDHRDHQGELRVGVLARRDHRREDRDDEDGIAPPLSQAISRLRS